MVNSYGTTPGDWQDVGADKQDGADMTEAEFKDATFFANNLPNWNFGGFVDPIWEMKADSPLLVNQITPPTLPTAIHRLKTSSKANVYASNGKVYIKGAEKNSTIRIYNISGVLLQEIKVNSSVETFDTQGLLIIEVVSPEARGTYKVNSLYK